MPGEGSENVRYFFIYASCKDTCELIATRKKLTVFYGYGSFAGQYYPIGDKGERGVVPKGQVRMCLSPKLNEEEWEDFKEEVNNQAGQNAFPG